MSDFDLGLTAPEPGPPSGTAGSEYSQQIQSVLSGVDNPADYIDRLNASAALASELDRPFEDVYRNFEEYAQSYWGRETAPLTAWQSIRRQGELGQMSVEIGRLGTQLMMDDSNEAAAERLAELYATMPSGEEAWRGLPVEALKAMANQIPFMGAVQGAGFREGMAGAGAGALAAAIGGQAGPQALLPEEIVSIPMTAIAGYRIGSRVGRTAEASRLSAGFVYAGAYMRAKEAGLDAPGAAAKAIAAGAGLISGLLENAQIDRLLGTDKAFGEIVMQEASRAMAREMARDSAGRVLARFAGQLAVNTGAEVLQEIAQESVEFVAEELIVAIENRVQEADMPMSTFDDFKELMMMTAQQSLLAFAPMSVYPSVMSTVQEQRTQNETRRRIQTVSEGPMVDSFKRMVDSGAFSQLGDREADAILTIMERYTPASMEEVEVVSSNGAIDMRARGESIARMGIEIDQEAGQVRLTGVTIDQRTSQAAAFRKAVAEIQSQNPGYEIVYDKADPEAMAIQRAIEEQHPDVAVIWQSIDLANETVSTVEEQIVETLTQIEELRTAETEEDNTDAIAGLEASRDDLRDTLSTALSRVDRLEEAKSRYFADDTRQEWQLTAQEAEDIFQADAETDALEWAQTPSSNALREMLEENSQLTPGQIEAAVVLASMRARALGVSANTLVERYALEIKRGSTEAMEAESIRRGKLVRAGITIDDAKSVIYLAENATFRDVVHELAHYFTATLTEEEISVVEKEVGDLYAEDGARNDIAWERLAWMTERYVFDGIAENDEIRPILKRLADFIRKFYRTIEELVELSPSNRAALDAMYGRKGRYNDGRAQQGGDSTLMSTAPETMFSTAPPTDSEAFKEWFGDSVVVDGRGEPLVLYHGSDADFESFDTQRTSYGYFFTDDQEAAEFYGENLYSVYVKMEKPADLRDPYEFMAAIGPDHDFHAWIEDYFDSVDEFTDWALSGDLYAYDMGKRQSSMLRELEADGFDGVIFSDARGGGGVADSYVVFDSTQVKSVHNRGTWDGADPRMLYQTDNQDQINWRRWEPKALKNGGYEGAPKWVQTRKDLVAMRRLLRKLVQEGIAGRFWYEDSTQEILRMSDGDPRLAEKFINVIAIYSSNTSVPGNNISAIRAFTHWRTGQPRETLHSAMGSMDEKAKVSLYDGATWQGRKTNSFYGNLMYDLLQQFPELATEIDVSDVATMDLWMARAFGYLVEQYSNDKGSGKYSFSENSTRRLAAELNEKLLPGERRWTPHQVQAAIWTAMKTRYEFADVKKATMDKSREEGLLVYDKNGKEHPPSSGQKAVDHRQNWRAIALQKSSAEVTEVANQTSRSFKEEIERSAAMVTWEAVPSTFFDHDINHASREVKREFTTRVAAMMFDANGQNVIAKALGIGMTAEQEQAGGYAGDYGPNNISYLVPARTIGSKGFDRKVADAYARALQYIFKQDAVPWMRFENNAVSIRDSEGFKLVAPDSKGKIKKVSGSKIFDDQLEAQAEADRLNAEKRSAWEKKKKKDPEKWVDPVSVRGGELSRGVRIRFDKTLTGGILEDVVPAIDRVFGSTDFTKISDTEIIIVNFRDPETGLPWAVDDVEFMDKAKAFATDMGAEIQEVRTDGNYGLDYTERWAEDPEGLGLLDTDDLSGRPALQKQLRAWRDEYEKLLEEYSGEGLRKAERRAKARIATNDELFMTDAWHDGHEQKIPADHARIVYGSITAAEDAFAEVVADLTRIEEYERTLFSSVPGGGAGRTAFGLGPREPRIQQEFKYNRRVDLTGNVVHSAADVAKLFSVYQNKRVEQFHLVYTDKEGKILAHNALSAGVPDAAPASERHNDADLYRKIKSRMARLGADYIYTVHNHPSGNVTQSPSDKAVMKRYSNLFGRDVVVAGVVVGDGRYSVIELEDALPVRESLPKVNETQGVIEGMVPKNPRRDLEFSPVGFAIAGEEILSAAGSGTALVALSPTGEVLGWEPFKPGRTTSSMRQSFARYSSPYGYIVTNDVNVYEQYVHEITVASEEEKGPFEVVLVEGNGKFKSAIQSMRVPLGALSYRTTRSRRKQSFLYSTDANHEDDVQKAVEAFEPVTDEVLAGYINQKWAQDEVASRARFTKARAEQGELWDWAREAGSFQSFKKRMAQEGLAAGDDFLMAVYEDAHDVKINSANAAWANGLSVEEIIELAQSETAGRPLVAIRQRMANGNQPTEAMIKMARGYLRNNATKIRRENASPEELRRIQRQQLRGIEAGEEDVSLEEGAVRRAIASHDEIRKQARAFRDDPAFADMIAGSLTAARSAELIAELDGVIARDDSTKKQRERAQAKRAILKKHRAYMERLGRLATRKLPKTIDARYRVMIEEMQRAVDPKWRREKTINLKESRRRWLAENPEARSVLRDSTLKGIEAKSLNEWTEGDLEGLVDQIALLTKIGKNKQRIKNEMFAGVVQQYVQRIEAAVPEPRVVERNILARDATQWDRAKRIAKETYWATLRPWALLDKADGGKAKYDGPMYRLFLEMANEAEARELQNAAAREAKVNAALADVGFKPADMAKTGKYGGFDMQRQEAIGIYAASMNEQTLNYLLNGHGMTEEEIARISADLTAEERSVASAIMNDYEENRERLREAHYQTANLVMEYVENYIPIVVVGRDYQSHRQQLTEDTLIRAGHKKAKPQDGMTKSRVRKLKNPMRMRLDIYSTWHDQIRKQEHYIEASETVKLQDRVLGDAKVKAALDQAFGPGFIKEVRGIKDRFANPMAFRAFHPITNQLSKIRNDAAAAYLSFNAVTAAKQVFSLPYMLAYTGPKYFLSGMAQVMTGYGKLRDFVYEKDPLQADRGIDRGYQELREMVEAGMAGRIKGGIISTGMFPIMFMDSVAVLAGWKGAYDRAMDQGLGESEAIRLARQAIQHTQPEAHAYAMASVQVNDSLKWFTQFSNQLSQLWAISTYDIPQSFRNEQVVKGMISIAGMGIAAYGMWALAARRPIPEDAEDWWDLFMRQILAMVPIAGPAASAAMYGFDNSPTVQTPFEAFGKALGAARTAVAGGTMSEARMERLAWDLYEGIAVASGMPYTAVKRGVDAVEMISDGESPYQAALTVVTGGKWYATKEEQKKEEPWR